MSDGKNIWEDYERVFPDRYLKTGALDERAKELAASPEVTRCLDIGGGNRGTEALKVPGKEVWAVDPFAAPPEWEIPRTWAQVLKQRFDLIVARGSINYLREEEIGGLPGLLNIEGVLLFNTFLHPTETSRPFSNEASGISGTERALYNGATGMVCHTLEFMRGGTTEVITHEFRFHPENKLSALLSPWGELTITKNKRNSALFELKRK